MQPFNTSFQSLHDLSYILVHPRISSAVRLDDASVGIYKYGQKPRLLANPQAGSSSSLFGSFRQVVVRPP